MAWLGPLFGRGCVLVGLLDRTDDLLKVSNHHGCFFLFGGRAQSRLFKCSSSVAGNLLISEW
jgi:hypothetical protein